MEWQLAGYEVNDNGSSSNHQRPLYRCPFCWVYRDALHHGDNHRHDCMIDQSLRAYTDYVEADASSVLHFVVDQDSSQRPRTRSTTKQERGPRNFFFFFFFFF